MRVVQQDPAPQPSANLRGILRHAAPAWANSSPWAAATIQNGLELKWKRKPQQQKHLPQSKPPNNDMMEVVNEGIALGLWRKATTDEKIQWISNVFLVPKPGKKGRLVINYAPLNHYLRAPHFKMEGWREAQALITPQDVLAKIDLTNMYYQVPLTPESQSWLAFQVGTDTYIPNGMPFGINLAPFTFTKLMKHPLREMREHAIRCIAYLDDILLISLVETAESDIKRARQILERQGFVLNERKSVLEPQKKIEFLGFKINVQKGEITIPQEKKDKVLKLAKQFSRATETKIRHAATVIGTLKALAQAIPSVHLQLFHAQKWMAECAHRKGWEAVCPVPDTVKNEVKEFVQEALKKSTAQLWPVEEQVMLTTDASQWGWGAWLVDGNMRYKTCGEFLARIKMEHSTLRELTAIRLACKEWIEKI